MNNDSKKVTTKENFFCNYEASLLSELYGDRVKGTNSPYQYILELDSSMNPYVYNTEALRIKFAENQLFVSAALFRMNRTNLSKLATQVLPKTAVLPYTYEYSVSYDQEKNSTLITTSTFMWSSKDLKTRKSFSAEEKEALKRRIKEMIDDVLIDCTMLRIIGNRFSLANFFNFCKQTM